ncbi:MAG: DUF4339 domain-containing protein [Planctomycetia bacterium]|nr:DUF4339 domain-containing protein [Planctomycetia bacterium]
MQTSEGTRYGPVTRAELDVWLAEDRLDAECQLLKEGWDQWKWAEEVFPQLKSAGAAASSEKDEDPFPVIADEGVAAKRGAPRLKAAGAPAIGVRADNPFAATDSGDPAQRVKHRRPISSIPVPDYVWLKFLGGVFTVIGLIVIGLAALATVIMLILAAVGSAQSSRAGDAIGGFVGMMFFNVMMFGMAFLTGAFYLAIGQALYAFRDMAQNSWKAVALLDKD